MRAFYLKEILVRTVLGFAIGVGVSIYLYGPEENKSRALQIEGKAEVNGKEVEMTSLEYSVSRKKKFIERNGMLPGKIRDD